MRSLSVTLILSFVIAGCGNRSVQNDGSSSSNGPAQVVSVIPVESRKLETTLLLPAQLAPYEVVDIYPKVTGFLDMITVDRGSRVHAGEVILRLSAPELVAQRAQAQSNPARGGSPAQCGASEVCVGPRNLFASCGGCQDSGRGRAE